MKIFQLIHWLTKLFKLNNKSKVILLMLMPLSILAQNNTAFWLGKRASAAPTNLLLDDYPGAAAAYSVRKLDKDYTGFAMEIRRASDNITQNIGFVGENLDEAAINSFCTGTTCYVKTWYDQSGNGRDAVQITLANQPLIYQSGVIIAENGKPSINFDGFNDYLSTSISVSFLNNWHNIVYKFINASTFNYIFSISSTSISNARQNLAKTTTNKIYFYDGITVRENGNTSNLLELSQIQFITISPFVNHYLNGATSPSILSTNYANNSSATGKIVLGALDYGSYANYMNGNISEFISYNADISTNRININNNINSYYSIY